MDQKTGQKAKVLVLQARNYPDMKEWVTVLNNMGGAPTPAVEKKVPASERSTGKDDASPGWEPPSEKSSPQDEEQQKNPRGKKLILPKGFDPATTPPSSPAVAGPQAPLQAAAAVATPPVQPISFDMVASGDDGSDSSVAELGEAAVDKFAVRFLGSMEVVTDKGDQVIQDTVRHILAARAQHGIVRTTQGRLIVDHQKQHTLFFADSETSAVKLRLRLEDLAYWTKHPENERLFAFIARMKGGRTRFACFVFEAEGSGAAVCKALSEGTRKAFQALLEQKRSRGDEKGTKDSVVNTSGGEGDSPPVSVLGQDGDKVDRSEDTVEGTDKDAEQRKKEPAEE